MTQSMSATLGIWIAAILTLCLYSFLYHDNPFYKFAEHLFVGVSAGYLVARQYFNAFLPYVWEPLKRGVGYFSERDLRQLTQAGETAHAQPSELIVVVPIILGLLFFAQFARGHGWLVRIPVSFALGASMGMGVPVVFKEQVYKQMNAAIIPFDALNGSAVAINAIIVLVGTIAALTYFFFSMEHRGAVGAVSRVGMWFLMIGFGSAFGNTVMNRVMLLIQRVEFLLREWLHLLPT